MWIVRGAAYVLLGFGLFWFGFAFIAVLGGASVQLFGFGAFVIEWATGWRALGPEKSAVFGDLVYHALGILDPAFTVGGYALFAGIGGIVLSALVGAALDGWRARKGDE